MAFSLVTEKKIPMGFVGFLSVFAGHSVLQVRSTRSQFWFSFLLVAPFLVEESMSLNHSCLNQAAWPPLGSASWEIWN